MIFRMYDYFWDVNFICRELRRWTRYSLVEPVQKWPWSCFYPHWNKFYLPLLYKKLFQIFLHQLFGSNFLKSVQIPGKSKKTRFEVTSEKNNLSELCSSLRCIQFWNSFVFEEDDVLQLLLFECIQNFLQKYLPTNETSQIYCKPLETRRLCFCAHVQNWACKRWKD